MMTPEKLGAAHALMENQSLSKAHICKIEGVSRKTLYRYLTLNGERR